MEQKLQGESTLFCGANFELEGLRHESAQLVRCLYLHLHGGVGIGVQSEASAIMPQHGRECFHIHTVLERQCCESMAKLVEAKNEAIPVEVENRTWYNSLKGYGLCHSPF